MKLNRRGTFTFSYEQIIKDPEMAMAVLRDVLIIRAENDFVQDTVTYSGCSEHFDEVERHMKAPEYEPLVTKQVDGSVTVKWRRK
jgi:hypothetical protein